MIEKDVLNLSLTELQQLENFNSNKTFTDIIFVPMNKLHDSGFRCMKFVLVKKGKIVGVVSGWSDVAHINGIGGYGKDGTWLNSQMVKRVAWNIDCLPISGCIRLFADSECVCDDFIGSDFCFYAI